jgi:hypothetical protein
MSPFLSSTRDCRDSAWHCATQHNAIRGHPHILQTIIRNPDLLPVRSVMSVFPVSPISTCPLVHDYITVRAIIRRPISHLTTMGRKPWNIRLNRRRLLRYWDVLPEPLLQGASQSLASPTDCADASMPSPFSSSQASSTTLVVHSTLLQHSSGLGNF